MKKLLAERDLAIEVMKEINARKLVSAPDEWTRESLEIDVHGSIRSGRVIEVFSRLISIHGPPRYLRSDNGPEFVSRAVLKWPHKAGIDTALIDPSKPWQNGSDESFNGRFRDECLSREGAMTQSNRRSPAIPQRSCHMELTEGIQREAP